MANLEGFKAFKDEMIDTSSWTKLSIEFVSELRPDFLDLSADKDSNWIP